MQAIDIHNLTHLQTREPPARVSYFLRVDGSKNGINMMSEGDKKEIINFMMTKIFCVSQSMNHKGPMHREYLTMVEMLVESVADRNLFISTLGNLFKGKSYFAPSPFDNLEKSIIRIYDSYCPKSEENKEDEVDFTGFERTRSLTKLYY